MQSSRKTNRIVSALSMAAAAALATNAAYGVTLTMYYPGFARWQWTSRIVVCRLAAQIRLFFDIEDMKSGDSNG